MSKKMQPLTLDCCECSTTFEHSVGAQRHYKENGWVAPIRCMNCRAAKKVLHLAPIEITCIKCETKFNFSAAAQKHFKEQGWVVPIRCFDCRKTNPIPVARRIGLTDADVKKTAHRDDYAKLASGWPCR